MSQGYDDPLPFLQQPGLANVWPLVKKKFESYGRPAGIVPLSGLSPAEREAIEGLFTVNMYGRNDFKLNLAALEQALLATRFRLTLAEALRLLYGDAFTTRAQRAEEERRKWSEFVDWAIRFVRKDNVRLWVRQLAQGGASDSGMRAFAECFEAFCRDGVCEAWELAVNALEQLPLQGERLPVFAARMTGNPHGLDRGSLAGRLFYHGIVACFTEEQNLCEAALDEPGTSDEDSSEISFETAASEAVRQRYGKAGILLDDVSSIVLVAGWPSLAVSATALPLMTVEALCAAPLQVPRDIYVTENPSVFGSLMDKASSNGYRELPHPLVCTSGQPSLAALRLLDCAALSGARLWYSGDFDVKGVEMASSLARRYSGRFHPWRMNTAAYRSVRHERLPKLSEAEKLYVSRLQAPWDPELTSFMAHAGYKVFQEHLLEELLLDYFHT